MTEQTTFNIDDPNFYTRLNKRDIAFAKGDILKIRIRTETRKTNEGLKTDRKVVEVLDVIPGQEQYPSPGTRPQRKIDL